MMVDVFSQTAPAVSSQSSLSTRLQAIRAELNTRFIECADIIDVLFAAAIAKKHIALIGPPGEAKSNLCEAFAARIDGARYFNTQLHAQTKEEAIFGPLNPLAIAQGRYERVIKGRFADAHIVVLDEVWNAGALVHNPLNRGLNERKYENDGVLIEMPLLFALGSSNRMPMQSEEQGEDTRAAQDRWLFWVAKGTLSEAGHTAFMHDELARRKQRAQHVDTTGAVGTTITLDELLDLQSEALAVTIPDEVYKGWEAIRQELQRASLPLPSTRRASWLLDAIGAHTVLMGRNTATMEDLAMLQYCLWQRLEDVSTVQKIVLKVANPMLEEVQSLLRLITAQAEEVIVFHGEAAHTAVEKTQRVIQATTNIQNWMKTLHEKFLLAKAQGSDTAPIRSCGQQGQAWLANVVKLEKANTSFSFNP